MRLTFAPLTTALLVSAVLVSLPLVLGGNEHQLATEQLHNQKRASSGHSGSQSPTSSTGSYKPAWHEHPMWDHPALKQGARLWPSPSTSSSDHNHRPHSPTHSTGSKPFSVKGKEVATSTSHHRAGQKRPLALEHPPGSRPFTFDKQGNLAPPRGRYKPPKRPQSPSHSTGSDPASTKGKGVALAHPPGSRPFSFDKDGNLKNPSEPKPKDKTAPQRAPGRPLGSKDREPSQVRLGRPQGAKDQTPSPNRLGRPKGAKDKFPRKSYDRKKKGE